MAVLTAFAALWCGVYLRSRRGHTVLARVILRDFLWDIALPILLAVSGPLLVLALVTELDFRVWQALIAGVFIGYWAG